MAKMLKSISGLKSIFTLEDDDYCDADANKIWEYEPFLELINSFDDSYGYTLTCTKRPKLFCGCILSYEATFYKIK